MTPLRIVLEERRLILLSQVWRNAVVANQMAKQCQGPNQDRAYAVKARRINHVLERDPDGVRITDRRLLRKGIIGVAYRDLSPLHVRIERLSGVVCDQINNLVPALR